MRLAAIITAILVALALACFLVWGLVARQAVRTIRDLLEENDRLKTALTNLTDEGRIGYAKVTARETVDGTTYTTIRFVETQRDNPLVTVFEKEFTVTGTEFHFDAIVVRFGNRLVADGKARSLFLWRRAYSDTIPPDQGVSLEQPGAEPAAYRDLLKALPVDQRNLFWEAIWDLANNPEKLREHDITAVYGSVVYTRMKPGLIYVFKLTNTGQFYPEVVPSL